MATVYRELASPLQIDSTGGFAVLTTPSDIAAQHVRSVIGTEIGERVMRADYGAATLERLFGPINDAEITLLETDISTALATWAPEVRVTSIDASADESNLNVVVNYALAHADQQTVTVTLPVTTG